jgi:hypothetical protein
VKDLHRAYDVYARLLCDEAQKVQQGILREGGIANRALELIAQAQNQRRRFFGVSAARRKNPCRIWFSINTENT